MTDEEGEREADWKDGWHTDADGKRRKLDNMNYEHLEYTIKLFAHLDVRPLRRALRRKQPKFIPVVIDYLERREKLARKKGSTRKAKKRTNLAKAASQALKEFIDS
jgi:hypothetical protein